MAKIGMVQSWVAAEKPALSEVEWAQLGDGKIPIPNPINDPDTSGRLPHT